VGKIVARYRPGRRILLMAESFGDLRAALLVFEKGNVLYPKFFGSTGARGDYFYLAFSWLVEIAIAYGATRIEYGGGCHQAKLLRGGLLRWLFGGVRVYDERLDSCLSVLLPLYHAAKLMHFSELAKQYQIDHTPPPLPREAFRVIGAQMANSQGGGSP